MRSSGQFCGLFAVRSGIVAGLALFATTGGPAGCSTPPEPPAAASNRPLTEAERHERPVLDATERRAVVAALTEVAAGHVPVAPPAPAAAGMRWSDLDDAMAHACDDVEMAVTRRVPIEGGVVYRLKTLDDRPGCLTVMRRDDDDRVYEARAVVGWFEDDHEKAEALLAALEKQMRAFGKKRGFEE